MNKDNYILLTGPTGVGKSSVMDSLSKVIPSITYSDPYVDNPFIADAYLSNDKCFQSQLFFFKEFLKIHLDIKSKGNEIFILQERSIFESVYIFCRNLFIEGNFSRDEYELMKDLLSEVEPFLVYPKTIISLTASPDEIYRRILKRGRAFESNIQINFIEKQINLYSDWIKFFSDHHNCKIIEIDTSFKSIKTISENLIERIIS